MAVRQARGEKKAPGFFGKILRAVILLSFFGYFVLLLWSLYLWASEDFNNAMHALNRLSLLQAGYVSELGQDDLSANLSNVLNPKLKQGITSGIEVAGLQWQEVQHQLKTGLDDFRSQMGEEEQGVFWEGFDGFKQTAREFYLLALACAHVLMIKVLIIFAAFPLFILLALAGFIDGLNQRAIRTASLGRESTFVFHKSIPIATKTMFWVLAAWLALPLSLPPSSIFLGLSLLLSLVVSQSASRFKKYL